MAQTRSLRLTVSVGVALVVLYCMASAASATRLQLQAPLVKPKPMAHGSVYAFFLQHRGPNFQSKLVELDSSGAPTGKPLWTGNNRFDESIVVDKANARVFAAEIIIYSANVTQWDLSKQGSASPASSYRIKLSNQALTDVDYDATTSVLWLSVGPGYDRSQMWVRQLDTNTGQETEVDHVTGTRPSLLRINNQLRLASVLLDDGSLANYDLDSLSKTTVNISPANTVIHQLVEEDAVFAGIFQQAPQSQNQIMPLQFGTLDPVTGQVSVDFEWDPTSAGIGGYAAHDFEATRDTSGTFFFLYSSCTEAGTCTTNGTYLVSARRSGQVEVLQQWLPLQKPTAWLPTQLFYY